MENSQKVDLPPFSPVADTLYLFVPLCDFWAIFPTNTRLATASISVAGIAIS